MIHLSEMSDIRRASLPGSNFQQRLQEISQTWLHQPRLLLSGETGTGKTYLARHLPGVDPSVAAFREFNCRCDTEQVQELLSGLPASLQQQTAATPASADTDSVTLLREIEALTVTQQQRLARQLEQLDQSLSTPATKWILTTRADLKHAVNEGTFREDLYYRISMFRFDFPPLRQRYAEIQAYTRQFVKTYTSRYQRRIERIDESFLRGLFDYHWPGNIRELQHVIERAVIYCRQESLNSHHLPEDLQSTAHPLSIFPRTQPVAQQPASGPAQRTDNVTDALPAEITEASEETLESRVAEAEREQIEQALQRNLQSRTRAARELGISRVTLYNKMKKLGLDTRKIYDT